MVHRHNKFIIENRKKYIIFLDEHFYYSKRRSFVFRTDEQIVEFFKAAYEQGILDKFYKKGPCLISFTYRDKEFGVIVEINENENKATTTIISAKGLLRMDDERIELFRKENRIEYLKDFFLELKIVPRPLDVAIHTLKQEGHEFKFYISYYLHTSKEYFFSRYSLINTLPKIANILMKKVEAGELNICESRPFWLWGVGKDQNERYLICLAARFITKNKQKICEVIVDQIHKNFIKDIEGLINEQNEELLDEEITLSPNVFSRKKQEGIKIVKKTEAKKDETV